jgi:hypothetical protein
LRSVSTDLGQRIVKTIPKRALEEVGDAIGIRRNGVLVFDTRDMSSVLMDCCLYDWFENGKNLVQRYSETHPAKPGTDESYLLNAYLQAEYRILVTETAVPGAGLHCRDILNRGDLFLMDRALSQSLQGTKTELATRTIPLGDYCMTGGSALPINSSKVVQDALSRMRSGKQQWLESPGGLPLLIVRACLASGAADSVAYEGPATKPRKSRRRPRWRGV